jgi:hypothetical protein
MHQFDSIFVLPLTFGQPTKQLELERPGRSTSIFDTAVMCARVVPQQPLISLAPCVAISRASVTN